mmetsp:Transcript_27115/g.56452  ORF Transcript_27115/g.56452 Transcript_27115/m.56452 type:complete len:228 (+) Transcript_27115:279-962(+)
MGRKRECFEGTSLDCFSSGHGGAGGPITVSTAVGVVALHSVWPDAAGCHHCVAYWTDGGTVLISNHITISTTHGSAHHAATINATHTRPNRKFHTPHIPHTHRRTTPSIPIIITGQYIHRPLPPVLTIHLHSRRRIVRSLPQLHFYIQRPAVSFHKGLPTRVLVRVSAPPLDAPVEAASLLLRVGCRHHAWMGGLGVSLLHVVGAWVFVDRLMLARGVTSREVGLSI